MKITSFIYVALLCSTITFSDRNDQFILREIFYDLPVEDSRSAIISAIESDSRFVIYTDYDTTALILNLVFEGCKAGIKRVNFNVGVEPIASSIHVVPSLGFPEKRKKLVDFTIISLKYTYLEQAAAEKTFAYYWNKIKGLGSDTLDIAIGEETERDYMYGKKIKLNKKQEWPSLSVLRMDTKDTVAIFVVFERKGK